MGNTQLAYHSNEDLNSQNLENYYDPKFGAIKIYKKQQFPYIYVMILEVWLQDNPSSQQIRKFTDLLTKITKMQMVNIAKIYKFETFSDDSKWCIHNSLQKFTIYQDYFTFNLKNFRDYHKSRNSQIQERYLWYTVKCLIEIHLNLSQNRINHSFTLDDIFLSIQGHIVIYPNFYYCQQEKKMIAKIGKQQNKNFRIALLKILMSLIYQSQQHDGLIDQLEKYSDIAILLKFKRVLRNWNYSIELLNFINFLASQLLINWKKLNQRFLNKQHVQISDFLTVNKNLSQWYQVENKQFYYYFNKQNEKISEDGQKQDKLYKTIYKKASQQTLDQNLKTEGSQLIFKSSKISKVVSKQESQP